MALPAQPSNPTAPSAVRAAPTALSLYAPEDSTTADNAIGQDTENQELPSRHPAPVVTRRESSKRTPTYWAHRAQSQSRIQATVEFAHREKLLRSHGNYSLAYSVAVQPRLEYFGGEKGVIAYSRRCGIPFALGDPLAPESLKPDLIDGFLQKHPNPSFLQIHASTAEILVDRGFLVNEMGVDTRLDLQQYHFSGKSREWLRYADNWVSRRGFQIAEFPFQGFEQTIEDISEAWRKTRTVRKKEVRFLNRPIAMETERDVRRFGLFDQDAGLQAFVFFDPLYEAGQIVGYVTCIKRRLPKCTGYAETAIMKRAIEQFQSEGISSVWLGLSPFAHIENQQFAHSRFLHHLSRYHYSAGWFNRFFYNFKGHSEFKRRFEGEEHKVYYASRGRFDLFRLITLASVCGVF